MNDNRHLDDFHFGIQYYRAPTPLPDEWEEDMKNITALGFDCIQIRMLWRKNERIRGVYDFSDTDRLMDLARKNGQKVIIKFLLENAPDYVFRDFEGAPVNPDGIPMDYTGNGAFYLGGHRPCFDNPQVMAQAVQFVRTVVERYKNEPHLILWNVWNEPRIHTGECACPHSKAAFRNWLKQRFGTVENLNDFLGKAWDSFESVQIPRTFRTYSDMFLWRQWSHVALTGWLQPLKDAVKELDDRHPVMAHVGCCNLVNDPVDDATDDYENARIFDFYGTSLSVGERFETPFECSWPFLILARLFDCSPYFWVHELYPEWGDWQGHVAPSVLRYKVMSAIAGGAKGVVLWQYRAERLGHENDLSGLVNIDGTPKAVTHECEKLISEIRQVQDLLVQAVPETDPVGILFDLPSDLMGTIESRNRQGEFKRENGGLQPYIDALQGIFSLFHDMKLAPRIIDSRHLENALSDLKVLYLPETFIVSEETAILLRRFTENGGLLIAEEGLALRHPNTWLNYPWPGCGMSSLFGVTVEERVNSTRCRKPWKLYGVESLGYNAALKPVDRSTTVLQCWDDGRPAITRRGNCIFLGFSPGCWSLYSNQGGPAHEARYNAIKELMKQCFAGQVQLPDLPDKVMVRTLHAGSRKIHVVFNRGDVSRQILLDGREVTIAPGDSRIVTSE